VETTARYTRVATGIISAIKSPLEALSPKVRDEPMSNRKRKQKGRPPAN
jgi:hypothetical protein